MTSKQPTQEQLKKFWEWCGLKEIKHKGYWNNLYWKAPEEIDGWEYPIMPCIDLNKLFKYAVPRLRHFGLLDLSHHYSYIKSRLTGDSEDLLGCYWRIHLEKKILEPIIGEPCIDPALALFWAIWKVIENES